MFSLLLKELIFIVLFKIAAYLHGQVCVMNMFLSFCYIVMILLSDGVAGVSRIAGALNANESVIPSVSESAITQLNGKIGIVYCQLLAVGCAIYWCEVRKPVFGVSDPVRTTVEARNFRFMKRDSSAIYVTKTNMCLCFHIGKKQVSS